MWLVFKENEKTGYEFLHYDNQICILMPEVSTNCHFHSILFYRNPKLTLKLLFRRIFNKIYPENQVICPSTTLNTRFLEEIHNQ